MSEITFVNGGTGGQPAASKPDAAADFRELEKELGRLALKDIDAQKREEKLEKELAECRDERQLIAMQKIELVEKLRPTLVKQAKGKR